MFLPLRDAASIESFFTYPGHTRAGGMDEHGFLPSGVFFMSAGSLVLVGNMRIRSSAEK